MKYKKASRSQLLFIAGIGIGGIFLWLAIRDVDFSELFSVLRGANPMFCIPFVGLLALFYWLKASRWAMLLAQTKSFSTRDLAGPMMIGFAGNNILPARLGELLRIVVLGKKYSISKTVILTTLVIERVFDAFAILLLLALAMLTLDIASPELSAARVMLVSAISIAIFVFYLIIRAPKRLTGFATRILQKLPKSSIPAVLEKTTFIREGLKSIESGRKIVRIAINSIAQWLLLAMCIYVSFLAFDTQLPISSSFVLLSLLVAGISIPSAPGFIGTIELCFVVGLGLFGIGASNAFAIAIFYHILTFAFVTLCGGIFFVRHRGIISPLNKNVTEVRTTPEN